LPAHRIQHCFDRGAESILNASDEPLRRSGNWSTLDKHIGLIIHKGMQIWAMQITGVSREK